MRKSKSILADPSRNENFGVETKAVATELSVGGTPDAIARRLVAVSIDFHTRWRGLRTSLPELVLVDANVSRFYRKQRRRLSTADSMSTPELLLTDVGLVSG